MSTVLIEININNAIKALNRRYEDREQFKFMKKIDALIIKIDILSDIKHWIIFVEEYCLECHIKKLSEEYSKILEEAEFFDELSLYFCYKLLLELHEFTDSVKIKLKVYSGNTFNAWKNKMYFQKLLNSFENINLSVTEQIGNLDKLWKEIEYHNKIKIHGNAKSISGDLLGIKKYKSFRSNSTSEISYKINKIGRDFVKEIHCPVCEEKKTLYWNNKDEIFKFSRTKVTFICDHIGSDYYGRLPVEIDLKKYKKNIKGATCRFHT